MKWAASAAAECCNRSRPVSTTFRSDGHYAQKQLESRSRLISWSHRSRFATAIQLAGDIAGAAVLDYGSGDGTFLAALMSLPRPPARAVGAELTPDVVADCRARLADIPVLTFALIEELDAPSHQAAYDLVVCMEVLEHVVAIDTVLDRLVGLTKPGGRLLISVPVETGIPILVKQTARTIAGWRGIGDYPGTTPYTWAQLAAALFAGERQHIERVVHTDPGGFRSHDHKGFNWKTVRERLARRTTIEQVHGSPASWLPAALNSQAWLVCRRAV